jgi:hypothetical protein
MAALLSLAACGGGGVGGAAGGGGQPTLLTITVTGLPIPLWPNLAGIPTAPSACPSPVFLNADLTFNFGGAVEPSSLPAGGMAVGSINITTTSPATGTVAARGEFSVSDDPSLAAGNRRRVNFVPAPPSDPNDPSTGGLSGNAQYTIFVPKAGNGPQVLNVAGSPLAVEAVTCFVTCDSATLGAAC